MFLYVTQHTCSDYVNWVFLSGVVVVGYDRRGRLCLAGRLPDRNA